MVEGGFFKLAQVEQLVQSVPEPLCRMPQVWLQNPDPIVEHNRKLTHPVAVKSTQCMPYTAPPAWRTCANVARDDKSEAFLSHPVLKSHPSPRAWRWRGDLGVYAA
eukprot:CAMPEP_0206254106 /NCGR_PEP_ID=MMETSP0047_2-20121206/23517_1 /ASSEMBLY_ACC=CAM_ASM_000192 /TAXON_ID=195065 /ORGANISM="Chroomonas mesostigmatica_cf, Strain CCMP1168" /LENGTH=105 /DNA_ID=CAMNT_0053680377 /DNA_START=225 /DNA_END=539 /DNA_ORIENTATION=+